jgi:hypothetical protein
MTDTIILSSQKLEVQVEIYDEENYLPYSKVYDSEIRRDQFRIVVSCCLDDSSMIFVSSRMKT